MLDVRNDHAGTDDAVTVAAHVPIPVERALSIKIAKDCTWKEVALVLREETGHWWQSKAISHAVHRFKQRASRARPITSPWTEDKIELLKQLRAEGKSARVIAAAFGMSRNAVIGQVHRLGLSKSAETKAVDRITKKRLASRIRNPFGKPKTLWPSPSIAPTSLPPLTNEQTEYILGTGVALLELQHHHRRWPLNEPSKGEAYFFCGKHKEQRKDGSLKAYCPHHADVAYGRGKVGEAA